MRLAIVFLVAAVALVACAQATLLRGNADSDNVYARRDPNIGSFLQLTDLHIQLDYVPGSSPICTEVLCCREFDPKVSEKADPLGDYHCDATYGMLLSALEFSKSLNPDFVLWTGDNPSHELWLESQQYVLNDLRNITNTFNKYFAGSVPVFPLIGNHDTYPVDELPPPPAADWLMQPLTEMWGNMIPASGHDSFRHGGYYSALLETGFRLIVVNTQWADPLNFYLYANDTDPSEQLVWMESAFSAARQAGEKVLMAAHIPMAPWSGGATPDALPTYTGKFQDILLKYADIMVGSVYGHTHNDFFRILRKPDTKEPVHVMYVAPSITTYTDHNPAIREYLYDKTTKQIVDVRTYISDLSKDIPAGKITWQLEYVASSTYALKDMSPASWMELVNRMAENSPANTLFDTFMSFYDTSRPRGSCTGECKKVWLCRMAAAGGQDFLDCYK